MCYQVVFSYFETNYLYQITHMKMKNSLPLAIVIAIITCGVFNQGQCFQTPLQTNKYWVYFDDTFRTDQEPQPSQLATLQQIGAELGYFSRWLNALHITATNTEIEAIENLSYVKEVSKVRGYFLEAGNPSRPDRTFQEAILSLKPQALSEAGLNGTNIRIGVIDAGFYHADRNMYLKALFNENRILGVRDFVSPHNQTPFSLQESHLDNHGTEVLKMITGDDQKGTQFGLATAASFYLARTDHGKFEKRTEEEHWIAAIEWLDSLGIKLVNTSLGYTDGFDDPSENYTPSQIDGKTSAIARAAQIATEQKGMLIVVSAGNEGNKSSWKIISTPADAPGVLAVGATTRQHLKASYSSIGPSELPYLKPEVACFSAHGTSFSAPVITGLAACLWQAFPEAGNHEIRNAIIASSSFYPAGNNFIGYGIPDAEKALKILAGNRNPHLFKEIKTRKNEYLLQDLEGNEELLIFHKSDRRNVMEQLAEKASFRGKFEVTRPKDSVMFTTIKAGKHLYEIAWR